MCKLCFFLCRILSGKCALKRRTNDRAEKKIEGNEIIGALSVHITSSLYYYTCYKCVQCTLKYITFAVSTPIHIHTYILCVYLYLYIIYRLVSFICSFHVRPGFYFFLRKFLRTRLIRSQSKSLAQSVSQT